MTQHVIAFKATLPMPGVYTSLSTVEDQVFSTASTTGIYVPAGMRLVAAYAGLALSAGAFFGRARLNAASFLRVAQPFITPVAATIGDNDPNFQLLIDRPLLFPSNEVIGVDALVATIATTADVTALLFFADKINPVPPGDGYWIRGFVNASASLDAWSTIAIAWDVTLPEGNYAVVGIVHVGPAAAARLVFPGVAYRPGVVSVAAASSRTHAAFYEGGFGVLGSFSAFAPPGVQVLATTASASDHEIYLRVVPT